MKKLLMFLIVLALLAFSGFAYADSFNMGGKNIDYNIPDGYVEAQGPAYSMFLSIMQQAMPPGLRIQKVYISQADDEEFRRSNGNTMLNSYLVITTMDTLANHALTAKDFKDFKRELKENQGLLDDAQNIARERIDDVFSGQIQFGDIQTLGCFGETNTELSYIIIMDQQVNAGGKMINFRQALVLTGVFTNERLVFVNQYRTVENEAEVSAFQSDALDVLRQMNFAGSQSVSQSDSQTDTGSGMQGTILIIIVIIAVILIIIIIAITKRKNRDGDTIDKNHNDHTGK